MADTITLEFLAARVGVLTDEVHDLKLRFGMMEARLAALETRFSALETRFSALEARFSAFENRFAGQEERMTRMLAILVRLAQAQSQPAQG
jgi:uncharacterized coiled-coil protein SlyX